MYFYIYELKTVVLIFVLFRVAMEHLASLQAGHLLNPEVINQNQPANNRYGHRSNPEVVNQKQPVNAMANLLVGQFRLASYMKYALRILFCFSPS